MTGLCSVYITCARDDEAEAIARALVDERLAACVNILGPVRSVYRWQGARQESDEIALIAKTRMALFDALAARVKALHSYAVPCITAWPIAAGDGDYLDWLRRESDG
jgi:periplasmic divalent cation tolerance protein